MLSILVLGYTIYSMGRSDGGGGRSGDVFRAIRLENFNHPVRPFWHMDCLPRNMNFIFYRITGGRSSIVIPAPNKLFPDGLRSFLHFLSNFEVQAYGCEASFIHLLMKCLIMCQQIRLFGNALMRIYYNVAPQSSL
jgi:hypothetical protein